jgi:hypothetical protein
VSVWAGWDGRAIVWRRLSSSGRLIREEARFRPWVLLDSLDPLGAPAGHFTYRTLDGPGALRYLVHAEDGRRLRALRDLGKERILILPPEEQYLVETGRTYFRDLSFDELHRFQFDLETTGLDAAHDRIFMIATRDAAGKTRGRLRFACHGGRDETVAIRGAPGVGEAAGEQADDGLLVAARVDVDGDEVGGDDGHDSLPVGVRDGLSLLTDQRA